MPSGTDVAASLSLGVPRCCYWWHRGDRAPRLQYRGFKMAWPPIHHHREYGHEGVDERSGNDQQKVQLKLLFH